MLDPFTAVGIGDMSGDVFGNGMLYTDSHPARWPRSTTGTSSWTRTRWSPRRGFAERQRLFDLPGSSWADYDRALLSPGGEVIDRTAKAVTPSAEVRAALGDPRRRAAGDAAERPDPLDPEGAGRSAVERRHRHVREGVARDERRRRRPCERRRADQRRTSCAPASSARAATSGSRNAAGSSSRRRAVASTPTSSTTRPASTRRDHEVNWKILLGLAIARGDAHDRGAQRAARRRARPTSCSTSCTTTTSRRRSCRRRKRSRCGGSRRTRT